MTDEPRRRTAIVTGAERGIGAVARRLAHDAYAVAVAATTSLAGQVGPHGITAKAIAPGFVVSDMTRASARRLGVSFEAGQVIYVAGGPVD